MAAPSKGRTIAIALLVAFLAVGVFFFNALDSNYPDGVDTDSYELRSVTFDGTDFDVITIDEERFIVREDNVEVFELADSSRDFLSRDQRTLWLDADTAESLGLEDLTVLG